MTKREEQAKAERKSADSYLARNDDSSLGV